MTPVTSAELMQMVASGVDRSLRKRTAATPGAAAAGGARKSSDGSDQSPNAAATGAAHLPSHLQSSPLSPSDLLRGGALGEDSLAAHFAAGANAGGMTNTDEYEDEFDEGGHEDEDEDDMEEDDTDLAAMLGGANEK